MRATLIFTTTIVVHMFELLGMIDFISVQVVRISLSMGCKLFGCCGQLVCRELQ